MCPFPSSMQMPFVTKRRYKRKFTVEQRFWSKIDKGGPTQDHCREIGGCWVWLRALRQGYGAFGVSEGVIIDAHRFSWWLHNGVIPQSAEVLHKCDNRRCVNPSHLFLGSKADNIADMVSKNRQAKGERMPQAKLTTASAILIRRLSRIGIAHSKIAERFNVNLSNISQIVHRKTWKHVGA
jgi:hypothetical protein